MSARNFAKIPEGLLFDRDISAHAVRLYGVLRRYADSEGMAFPGREELAAKMGVSVETVKRAMAELVRSGWAERRRRPDSNIWDTVITDHPAPEARVTGDPGSTKSTGHGRPVLTEARVTGDPGAGHGRPGHGSRVTRLEEREPTNESQLTRVTSPAAAATVQADELPLNLPAQRRPEPDPVQVLVGAYVQAVEATGGIATKSQCGAIGKNVKRLIADDQIELPVILIAVQRAGEKRSRSVDPFLGAIRAAWNDSQASRNAMRASWYEKAAIIDARKDAS